mgnify:CR=1 FL=1
MNYWQPWNSTRTERGCPFSSERKAATRYFCYVKVPTTWSSSDSRRTPLILTGGMWQTLMRKSLHRKGFELWWWHIGTLPTYQTSLHLLPLQQMGDARGRVRRIEKFSKAVAENETFCSCPPPSLTGIWPLKGLRWALWTLYSQRNKIYCLDNGAKKKAGQKPSFCSERLSEGLGPRKRERKWWYRYTERLSSSFSARSANISKQFLLSTNKMKWLALLTYLCLSLCIEAALYTSWLSGPQGPFVITSLDPATSKLRVVYLKFNFSILADKGPPLFAANDTMELFFHPHQSIKRRNDSGCPFSPDGASHFLSRNSSSILHLAISLW